MRYIYIPDAAESSGRKGEIYVRLDVLKVALLGCRRLGGPPRLAAGRLSAAGCKAGNKVGTLHAIPRRWAGGMGEAGSRGDCVALMRPADALAFPSGAGCGLSGA